MLKGKEEKSNYQIVHGLATLKICHSFCIISLPLGLAQSYWIDIDKVGRAMLDNFAAIEPFAGMKPGCVRVTCYECTKERIVDARIDYIFVSINMNL